MTKPLEALSDIRVVDLGLGMSAALAAKLLANAGAEIIRYEPEAGDPFYDVYPAYRLWQESKQIRTFDEKAVALELQTADVCILGGEDYPGFAHPFRGEEIGERFKHLVVLDITAGPPGAGCGDFPAVELLAQARSGLANEHYGNRPIMLAFPAASYGAALQGVAALLAALLRKRATGVGDVVRTSLLQGALAWCSSIWAQAENPPDNFRALIPRDVVPLRLECADGVHVHITPGVPGAYAKLYDILGIHDPTMDRNSRGVPTGCDDPAKYFGDVAMMAQYAAKLNSADVLKAMEALQLPGEAVLKPGECWRDPQAIHNGIIQRTVDGWETVGNPIGCDTVDSVRSGDSVTVGSATSSGAPLAGVKIVDMGCFAAGPYSSVILGDLGADVIKLERLEGDPMRPSFHHYAASNRGKRSIAVDAKDPQGVEIIQRLARWADVVQHNFRPGVSARLGVDARSLKQINPDIIVLESLAFGPDGPKCQQSGFDPSAQAICGHQALAGGENQPPLYYRIAIADYGTATLGAIAMLLALYNRQRGVNTPAIYVSLLNSAIFLMSELVRTPDGNFVGGARINANHLGIHPGESLYQTLDGWVAVAARDEAMAGRLADALGLDQVREKSRSSWGETEAQAIAAAIRPHATADLLGQFKDKHIWAAECCGDLTKVVHSPGMQQAGMLVAFNDPVAGRIEQIGRAFDFSRSPLPADGRGPIDGIGDHTAEILAELGYSSEEISRFFEQKIVA